MLHDPSEIIVLNEYSPFPFHIVFNTEDQCKYFLYHYTFIYVALKRSVFSSYEVINLSALFDVFVVLCLLRICIYKYSVCYLTHLPMKNVCRNINQYPNHAKHANTSTTSSQKSPLDTRWIVSWIFQAVWTRGQALEIQTNQSYVYLNQSPPSSGVSTVTSMSALIRAKGCWSGHPG